MNKNNNNNKNNLKRAMVRGPQTVLYFITCRGQGTT